MDIILSQDDFAQLSESTRAEILTRLSPPGPHALQLGPEFEDLDMDKVVNLTDEQVRQWMEAASDHTKSGVRVFAELGPVIQRQALTDAGINNPSHFQSRTTVRTRTVTGRRNDHLFGWNHEKYAVTPATYRALRHYFQLEDE